MRTFLSALLCLAIMIVMVSPQSFAASKVANLVMQARQKTGQIIRVSPKGSEKGGVPGTVTMEEAQKKARSGMVIEILPGYYDHINFTRFMPNNLIIQGDGSGKHCDVIIVFEGDNCVLRNIYCRSVEGDRVTIVDSKFHSLILTNGQGKPRPIVFNCAFNGAAISANRSEITIEECTVFREFPPKTRAVKSEFRYGSSGWVAGNHGIINFGRMLKKGTVIFEKCAIRTNECLFHFNAGNKEFLELEFENNLIYTGEGLAVGGRDKSGNPLPGPRDFKGLEDLVGKVKARRGQNKMEAFKMVKMPNWKDGHAGAWGWGWHMEKDYFIIADKGLDKKFGCNMGPKGIPVPRGTK